MTTRIPRKETTLQKGRFLKRLVRKKRKKKEVGKRERGEVRRSL